MAVGGAVSGGGTDDEEEAAAEIRLIRALPPSVMGLHFILGMRRDMGGLSYGLKDHSGYCMNNRLEGPGGSQGDQKGTVAVAQVRQDGGLGCRSGSEGGGNELRQRWPAGHHRSTSIVYCCGWEAALLPWTTLPSAPCGWMRSCDLSPMT